MTSFIQHTRMPENDELAYATERYYSELSDNTERGLAMYAGGSHFHWFGNKETEFKKKFRTLILF